ncbi:hypothetical protein ACFQ6N_37115 [Kitasatospora sp. NPDC056446]|uniref:hypothetical protein n=1 Tax=Kitasatospora sp. NPDC056446 TaxID=3345819 RepID=UPI0036778409
MPTDQRTKTLLRATALAATALLLTGTAARAAAPVSGTPAVITVGSGQALPSVSPDGATAYVVATQSDGTLAAEAVDTRSGQVTGTAPLGAVQGYLYSALSGDGSRLYVVDGLRLSVLDTAGPTVLATVALPDQPRPAGWSQGIPTAVVVSPDGAYVYVVQQGPSAWRQAGQARVLAFATAQRQFTSSLSLPAQSSATAAIRPDGRNLYVAGGSGVYHLSTAGGTLGLVGTVAGTNTGGDSAIAFGRDGRQLLAVSPEGGGTADLIDTGTDTVSRHLAFPQVNPGYPPRLSADGSRFYLIQNGGPDSGYAAVVSVDAVTGAPYPAETVVAQEGEGLTGLAVGPDGHTLYLGGTSGTDAELEIAGI